MIASPSQHHEDDEDIDMLRKIAMESLKKRERANDFNNAHVEQPQFQNFQPAFGSQPEVLNAEIPFISNSFPSARPPRMSGNPNYMRPRFMQNNFPPRHPVRPFIQNRMPPVHQQFPPQIPIRQDFVPIPHVNPQFLAQQQQPPQIIPPIFPANDFQIDYLETPKARLSPRTLKFIEENEEAIKKASSKRYSRRSHSGSPVRRRSRSRSPYKRRSPNDINRKRYRSKSPENRVYKSRNNSPKVEKRSKSPNNNKNRSQSPTRNARFARGRGRDGRDRYNGNGRFNNRKRSGSDRPRSKPKEDVSNEKVVAEKVDLPKEENITDKVKSPSPVPEKSTTPPLPKMHEKIEKKEKTQEELEDELLASTDEEDGDQLDINMDDNELDFLEDDSESENEGRFKSKPSSNVKPASLPSKSSSYKSYDKGKYSSSRNDYKRDDKYSSRRKDANESRKKSPDRKEISVNKDKDNVKSGTESERKPMFKSTFKSIDSGEKKADSTATKKSVTLVRSFVSKPDTVDKKTSASSVKSVITINEESSKSGSKRKIMERLGEFVGAKGKIEGNRSRATKQVFEHRNVMIGMKINGAVENKSMASRNTYCAI